MATLSFIKNKLKDKNRLSAFDLMNLIRSGNIPEGDELYGSSVPSEFVELTKHIRNLLNEPRKKPKDEPLVVSDPRQDYSRSDQYEV
jgi:hypothetical protein